MSVQIEQKEANVSLLTIEVPAEQLKEAIDRVYKRQKGSISIPGFRKGKVPQAMIERAYGAGVFYEDAANDLIPKAYDDAAKESGLDIVSSPRIEVTQIEKGKPFIFTAEVATKPPVKLGEYKGLEVPRMEVSVTDADVENALKREQEKNARMVTVEDRPIENDDTITLDYAGTIDGVAFDGGTAEGQTLVIGSGSFIPGFEEQLVGVGIGEEKDVEVSFPEDYHSKDLAGKAAVFHCKIHNIQKKELPEINDEFAEEVSEFDTLDEYKEDIRKNLLKTREENAAQNRKDQAASKAAENAEIDIPELMLESQAERMVENMANNLRMQGMDIQQYLQFTGQTLDQMREQMKPQARQQIRTRLTLEEIAKAENISVTDEDIDAEIEKIAESYKLEVDKMKEIFSEEERENLREDLCVRKAADLIGEQAVEVDVQEETEGELTAEEQAVVDEALEAAASSDDKKED